MSATYTAEAPGSRVKISGKYKVRFVGSPMDGFPYAANYTLNWGNGHQETSIVHTECFTDMIKLLAEWKEQNLAMNPPVELRAPGLDTKIAFFLIENTLFPPVCETYEQGGKF